MSTSYDRQVTHIFEALRSGLVPQRGIESFAVGIDRQRDELHRQLDLAEAGEGNIKFLRGGYGCGKTLMARLALLDAQQRNFATSFVVVSDNDLKFHKFDEVYRKVLTELGTASCPRGALGDILDRWIGAVEEDLVDGGEDDEAPDFDAKVMKRIEADLVAKTAGQAPPDFVRVIQTIFELKQNNEVADAGALISWLSGSANVAQSAKKRAGIKGDVESTSALDYLRGVLEIVKAAGYKGLLIVIDEAETILRMRSDSRHKSLNGIRQIADAAQSYPGLLWLFTGTPEFFDTRQGVAGLAPLHDRIGFRGKGEFVTVRQPQISLEPFKADRLRKVAMNLRRLYPAKDRDRLESRVDDAFIGLLVDEVTKGFKGDVGVVPRQFLREFVDVMDRVDEHEGFVPIDDYGFEVKNLTPEEQEAIDQIKPSAGDNNELIPKEDNW